MIFVTVGMHTAPFDRLVRAADAHARSVVEEVVIQRGASRYVPVDARSFVFCDSAELERLMRRSRVVVCHAGDTVLDALRVGRPVVAVPRRAEFGEVINDHQVEFAHALADSGQIQVVDDPARLSAAIDAAAQMPLPIVPAEPRLAGAIRRQLDEWY